MRHTVKCNCKSLDAETRHNLHGQVLREQANDLQGRRQELNSQGQGLDLRGSHEGLDSQGREHDL